MENFKLPFPMKYKQPFKFIPCVEWHSKDIIITWLEYAREIYLMMDLGPNMVTTVKTYMITYKE